MHLLACHGDVRRSGADTPKLESLSGLDAGSTAWVPRARNMVALIATAPRFAGTPPRSTCISIFSTSGVNLRAVNENVMDRERHVVLVEMLLKI